MRELLCLFVGISIFEVDLISSELMTATSEVSEKEKRVLERVSDILEQTGEGMSLTEFQVVIKIISSVRSSSSHPDLLLTHQHPTFSDHTGPQHWTFTF